MEEHTWQPELVVGVEVIFTSEHKLDRAKDFERLKEVFSRVKAKREEQIKEQDGELLGG